MRALPARQSVDAARSAVLAAPGRTPPVDTRRGGSHSGPLPSRPAIRPFHAPVGIVRAAPALHTVLQPELPLPLCLLLLPRSRTPFQRRSPPPACAGPQG